MPKQKTRNPLRLSYEFAKRRYYWHTLWLLVITAGLYASVFFARSTKYHSLLVALADAFLVAFVVSIIVDPWVKMRLAREVVTDVFWAMFNQEAPERLKKSLRMAAGRKVVYESTLWTITTTWKSAKKSVLRVEITVTTQGKNYYEDGYRPEGKCFVLASLSNQKSRYLEYAFSGSGSRGTQGLNIRVQRPELDKYCAPEEGRVEFDEERLVDDYGHGGRIGYGQAFHSMRKIEMFRLPQASTPMLNIYPSLKDEFEVRGAAAKDLEVTLLESHSGGAGILESGRTVDPVEDLGIRDHVIGSVWVLSWKPKDMVQFPTGDGEVKADSVKNGQTTTATETTANE